MSYSKKLYKELKFLQKTHLKRKGSYAQSAKQQDLHRRK